MLASNQCDAFLCVFACSYKVTTKASHGRAQHSRSKDFEEHWQILTGYGIRFICSHCFSLYDNVYTAGHMIPILTVNRFHNSSVLGVLSTPYSQCYKVCFPPPPPPLMQWGMSEEHKRCVHVHRKSKALILAVACGWLRQLELTGCSLLPFTSVHRE